MNEETKKKNVTVEADGSITYNFGKKRAVPNCLELLEDDVWKDKLLNKWVYMQDKERNVNTFIKHIFNGRRLIQVIYSGEDIYCDGVYKLYKVKIIPLGEDDIFVDPQEFSSIYSSFTFPEGTSYLDQLLADGFITEAEKEIFLSKEASDKFAKTLYQIPYDF